MPTPDEVHFVPPTEEQREVVSTTLNTNKGCLMIWQGSTLSAAHPRHAHTVDLTFKTSFFRLNEVDIPLWVWSDIKTKAKVGVYVNNKSAGTLEIDLSDTAMPVLYRVAGDVTRWAGGNSLCSVRLVISYNGQMGRVSIPLDGEFVPVDDGVAECDPAKSAPFLNQPWHWPTAMHYGLFVMMFWGSILALCVIVTANLPTTSPGPRLYSVGAVALAWLAGVAGVPDLANLPVKAAVRSLHGLTRRRLWTQWGSIALLFVLFLPVGVKAASVIYCLRIRQRYEELIHKAMIDDRLDPLKDIKDAFLLLPWRKETQFLFETNTNEKRIEGYPSHYTGNESHQVGNPIGETSREFAANPEISTKMREMACRQRRNKMVTVLQSWFDPLNYDDETAFSDPVIWYASLLPQLGDDKSLSDAIDVLSNRVQHEGRFVDDKEARILVCSLKLEQDIHGDRADDDANDLKKLLEDEQSDGSDYRLFSRYSYQVGCDRMGTYELIRCHADKALHWFGLEIKARSRISIRISGHDSRDQRSRESPKLDVPELAWMRPPEKLDLFYICVPYDDTRSDYQTGYALKVRALLGQCPGFREELNRDSLFSEYRDKSAWQNGTIFEWRNMSERAEGMLKRGWRY
jgi:hypothetical protein